jgi:hypothetical protein
VGMALVLASCGAASHAAGGSSGGSCVDHEHLSSVELAASPRADRDLEVLAATLGGTVAADPAIYDRLARDVAAARAVDPTLARVSYRTGHDGRTLMLEMDPTARQRVLAGADPTFEALRARFGPIQVDTPYDWVTVAFERVFDLSRVRDYYLRIPGMNDIGFNVLMGDGPTMCVERDEMDANWTYWFLDAGGDCPAGCTTLRVVGVRTDRAGTLTWIGASDSEGAGGLSPEAMAAAATCHEHATERAAQPTAICE